MTCSPFLGARPDCLQLACLYGELCLHIDARPSVGSCAACRLQAPSDSEMLSASQAICWPSLVRTPACCTVRPAIGFSSRTYISDSRIHAHRYGPRVRMGIYEGMPTSICPHTTSGMPDGAAACTSHAQQVLQHCPCMPSGQRASEWLPRLPCWPNRPDRESADLVCRPLRLLGPFCQQGSPLCQLCRPRRADLRACSGGPCADPGPDQADAVAGERAAAAAGAARLCAPEDAAAPLSALDVPGHSPPPAPQALR